MVENPDDTLRLIGHHLAEQADIRLGIVFGSIASGSAAAKGDLDIAVLGTKALSAERWLELMGALAKLTGRPVDPVDLSVAGLPITRSALTTGRRIYASDDTVHAARITRMLIDSADFLPIRERILNERRKAWLNDG